MDPEAGPEEILRRVREAHRLCAAFYQRVLPLIRTATLDLGLLLHSWNPRTSAIATKRGNPLKKWAWDNLPLMNARFAFVSTTEEGFDVDDYLVDLQLVTDSLLKRENLGSIPSTPDNKGPDATRLDEVPLESDTRFEILVFVPTRAFPIGDLGEIARKRFPGYPKGGKLDESLEVVTWGEGGFVVAMRPTPLTEYMHEDGVATLRDEILQLREAACRSRGGRMEDSPERHLPPLGSLERARIERDDPGGLEGRLVADAARRIARQKGESSSEIPAEQSREPEERS
jgi:hypothetical protein